MTAIPTKSDFLKKYFKIDEGKNICMLCPNEYKNVYYVTTNFGTLSKHLIDKHK